ncbi:MAG TPA: DUF5677 domain-containing protein [Acidimicrobiales bacterium]|nr:DUF5677 domain-containing protein [Acidimicrobiales bacterium]
MDNHDAAGGAGFSEIDGGVSDELPPGAEEVLAANNSQLLAAGRLVDLARTAVRYLSRDIHLPEGLGPDLVLRCIGVRAHETLTSVIQLIESGASHHARLLLRPLVEDLIFSGWLRTLDIDIASRFILLRAALDIGEGYEAQRRFLPTAYASLGVEPVPVGAPGLRFETMVHVVQKAAEELKQLGRPLGWLNRGPTVKVMAAAAGRNAEYEFFYLASSRSVHSNLHEMARMVWGDATSMTMTISSDTLAVLHSQFALTYGVWLYAEVLNELSSVFPPLRDLVESVPWSVWLAIVVGGMASNGRLPPIVSEEELHWPPTE